MVLVEQKNILNIIHNLTIRTCPQSIILSGPKGSGKHTLANVLAEHLGLEIIPLENSLNIETFDSIRLKTDVSIYTIEGSAITKKEEATLLKFLEEPPLTAIVLIYCNNKNTMLPTILNRCTLWEISTYSKDTLQLFSNDPLCLEIATTPGDCLELDRYNLVELSSFCNLILDKVKDANFSNILTIPNRIKFTDKEEGYEFDTFLKVFHYIALKKYIANEISRHVYDLVSTLVKNSEILHINKKYLLEHFLTELKILSL